MVPDYQHLNYLYYHSDYQKNVLGAKNQAKSFWDWVADPNREEYTNEQDVADLSKMYNNPPVVPGQSNSQPTQTNNTPTVNNPVSSNTSPASQSNNTGSSLQNQYNPRKALSYGLLRTAYGGL